MVNDCTNGNGQAALWNGDAGHAWVEAQALLDRMFKPMEDMLLQAISPDGDRHVLDVGCGTGGTTLAAARKAKGQCTGIDISAPMIEAARARAEQSGSDAAFLCGDAQVHPFEPGSIDLILSRFGVMFFDDPVAAFTNLHRAANPEARLHFLAWRSAEENPFMTAAERAASHLLSMPPRRPDEPGQFAFASESRVRGILDAAGWHEVDIAPVDIPCAFPADGLDRYLTRMGPLGRMLKDADELTRSRILESVRPAFDSYLHGDDVRYVAACWRVSARAGIPA